MRLHAIFSKSLLLLLIGGVTFAGPKMQLKEDGFNFGQILQGSSLTHAFWIKSVGDEPLRISEVVPGCGCTKAPLLDSVLAPGDSTYLQISLSTKGFRGNVNKRPYVKTNADDLNHYIKLDAYVILGDQATKPVSVSPKRVDVSQFDKPRKKGSFKLTNSSLQDFTLAVADSAFKSFDVKLPKKIKAGETIEAEIIVKEKAVKNDFEESLTIEVGDESRSRISIAVARVVRPSTSGS